MGITQELEERARRRLGTVLKGKYRIEAILGMGGMGVVYRASHRNRAELAIKMLHSDLSERKDVRSRFLREGYAANSVKHPGIVRVVDDDIAEDGAAFLVMDLLEGATVEELWERAGRRMPAPVAAAIVHQLLDVLAAAHRAGVVHRDVKPANLFVTLDGTVKVLDFGIARVLDGGAHAPSMRGVPIGTPTFMAPEQALAKSDAADPRTDVWGAGATFYTLVSGETVHDAATPSTLVANAAAEHASSLAQVAPDLPSLFVGVVDRALAFDASMRWQTAEAMRDALAQACEVGFGALPSKVTLAALVARGAPGSGTGLPAFESAPTMPAPEGSLPPGGLLTSAPISSTRGPVVAGRRARRVWPAAGLAIAVAAVAGIRTWQHRARAKPAPTVVVTEAETPRGAPLVFILGVENRTTDPELDGTVDEILESELYRSHRLYPLGGHRLRVFVSEVDKTVGALDDAAVRAISARTRRPVTIVRGAVSANGHGLALSLTAVDALSGAPLAPLNEVAPQGTLPTAVARLAASLRSELGDPPEAPLPERFVSVSLEAEHEFVVARGAEYAGNSLEALRHVQRALEVDPDFVQAQHLEGIIFLNVGREAEGRALLDKAVAHADILPERARLSLVGARAIVVDDLPLAIASYEKLLEEWPADTTMRSNLSIAYLRAGELARALEQGKKAAAEHPSNWSSRINLIDYEFDVGDLEAAHRDAMAIVADFPHPRPNAYHFKAATEALLGQRSLALQSYRDVQDVDASLAPLASADFAMFEGRLKDAAGVLVSGIAADEAKKDDEAAALKWAVLGGLRARSGDAQAAAAAALHAARSAEVTTLFLAGRVLAEAGREQDLAVVTAALSHVAGKRPLLFARLLEAERLRGRGRLEEALAVLGTPAGHDALLVHESLARVYLDLSRFEDAARELELCWAQRGALAAVLLDDVPFLSVLPPLRYWLARAKDGAHGPDAKDAYEAFLAMEPDAQEDGLAKDARRRLALLR